MGGPGPIFDPKTPTWGGNGLPGPLGAWGEVPEPEASGHTLTLKVRFADFRQITRSRTQSQPITDQDGITSLAELLLNTVPLQEGPVRLLGLTLSGLATRKEAMDEEQLSLPF